MIRSKRLIIGGVALACAAFVSGMFVNASSAQSDAEMQAMMEKWMAYMTPGEHHAELAKGVGKWNIAGQNWEHPGADPQSSKMVATIKPALGGRYFVEEVRGSFEMDGQEMPFEGRNLMGYDNMKEKYFFVWTDTWMTGIIVGEGTASKDGKTITYHSADWPNPMTGGFDEGKIVTKHVSDDEVVSTFYRTGPDGKMFKNMELVYKRPS